MLVIAEVMKQFRCSPYRLSAGTRQCVLDSVTLDAGPGETVGVLAREGEGKTTLSRIICGFLAADSGTVSVHGRTVKPGLYGVTSSVSGIIGGYASYWDRLTVEENINYYCSLHGMRSRESAVKLLDLVDLIGLATVRLTPAGRLSRGERRRLSLAIALIPDPKVLLIDEPLAGLKGLEAVSVMGLIRDLLRRQSRTVLLLTGNEDVAADLCTRAFILHGGKIVKQGLTGELFSDRAGVRYLVTVAGGSPVVMSRFTDDLGVCFPHATLKISGERAVVAIRDPDARVVYSLIDLAREHGLVLVDVSRSRSGLWADSYVGHSREGRKLWSL